MVSLGFKPWARKPAVKSGLAGIQTEAERLAMRLPPLLVEAERIAATVAHGVHGRRRVGSGETFWQFRRFRQEDPSQTIDWRQSAKSPYLFVRERESEAAQTVWIWRDGSPSMTYRSDVSATSKLERATLLGLALGALLIRAGERIAVLGSGDAPAYGKLGLSRVARVLTADPAATAASEPPQFPLPRFSQLVLLGDWLGDPEQIARTIHYYSAQGLRGHMIQVLDPAEEDLPFDGRTEFEDLEGPVTVLARRAEFLRESYKVKLSELRSVLGQSCRKQNWTFLTHRTDRAPQTALLALYAAMSAHRPLGGGAPHI